VRPELQRHSVQIAGIASIDEARLLLDAGVDYFGWPFRLDVHRPDLPEEEAARIIRQLSLSSRSVLITYLQTAREVIELVNLLDCRWVQLHGGMDLSELQQLRSAAPNLGVIQALVIGEGSQAGHLALVAERRGLVDAWITDTLDPASGARGATGLCHDWEKSRQLAEVAAAPLILAGGLKAGNVAEAISCVEPHAVDAHTGVENHTGAKDPALLRAFVEEARRAFRELEA
jgi:phosphoribosylanthranilate isomerase